MHGVVINVNPTRGMAAIATSSGYSVFEILEDGVEIGDKIFWKGNEPLGPTEVSKNVDEEIFSIYFQAHGVSEAALRQQLLY